MNGQTDGLIVSQPIKGFYPPVYNLYRQVRKEDLKRDGRNICIAKEEMVFFAFGFVLKLESSISDQRISYEISTV